MTTKRRPQDQLKARYIGPADRSRGEWRGHVVVVEDFTADVMVGVRFPDGTTDRVHENHLNIIR